MAKQNDKVSSLNIDKYRKDQAAQRTTFTQLEALLKLKSEIDVTALKGEENRWAEDKNKQERFNQWLATLRKDIYLDQAVKVMNDMIGQQNLVKAQAEPKKLF